MIPCLFITHNRLAYTKIALKALWKSHAPVFVIDNGSTDGTQNWLMSLSNVLHITLNSENHGIAFAMNQFLEWAPPSEFACKCDNDTVTPPGWAYKLREVAVKHNLDIVQAKHKIIPATHPKGWAGFTAGMKTVAPGVYLNHFVGGSGIIFRRSVVDRIPETPWMLGGWREFQRQHPELRKAFCEDVEIKLLDEHGYEDYPEYYKQTKRL